MARTWVIGHRGASGHAPENTMAAFRRAAEMGATFIETDLHICRDARLVAIHDATLERTTNGKGAVKDFSLAELHELDAGSWFRPEFAGERIPTLEDVMEFARMADVGLFLEVKQESAWGIEHGLVAALRAAKESHRVVILSFSAGILRNVRRLDPTVMTGLLFEPSNTASVNILDMARDIGVRQLAPRVDLVTPELVEAAHRMDFQVVCWTANEPAMMQYALAGGVDGIMTDYPDRLVAVVKQKTENGK
jgi:glycerophosphoryl diester phosphodiesterase